MYPPVALNQYTYGSTELINILYIYIYILQGPMNILKYISHTKVFSPVRTLYRGYNNWQRWTSAILQWTSGCYGDVHKMPSATSGPHGSWGPGLMYTWMSFTRWCRAVVLGPACHSTEPLTSARLMRLCHLNLAHSGDNALSISSHGLDVGEVIPSVASVVWGSDRNMEPRRGTATLCPQPFYNPNHPVLAISNANNPAVDYILSTGKPIHI